MDLRYILGLSGDGLDEKIIVFNLVFAKVT